MTDTNPAPTRSRAGYLCMNVEGFMRNNKYPRDYVGVFQHDDGRVMPPAEALGFLKLQAFRGRRVIPMSSECGNPCKHAGQGCTGFNYDKGCPGYSTDEHNGDTAAMHNQTDHVNRSEPDGSAEPGQLASRVGSGGIDRTGESPVVPTLPEFKIRDAVGSMQAYWRGYTNQPAWLGYQRDTFVNDGLFGVAIALGYESNAKGFDAFKAELLTRLQKEAQERVIWQAEQTR